MLHRQMLSAVSHDLKTPLASIIGSIEIYRRMAPQLSEQKRDTLLHTALVEAYRLDSFLTNILDLAKLENNLVPIRRESVNIRQLMDNMVSTLGTRRGDAEVTINGPADIDANIDGTLLARAAHLLVENAIKHGGSAPHVTITCAQPTAAQISVSVTDDGPGVPRDKYEEIFSKYTRLQRGDMQTAGTGLGLSIARIIAQRLGGDVTIVPPLAGEVGAHFVLTSAI